MKDDQQTDPFVKIASRILDLATFKSSGFRYGYDTELPGIDEIAADLLKKWVVEHLGEVVRAAIDDDEFIEKCARKFMDTPTNQQLDTYRTFNSWKKNIAREWLPPME